MYRATASILRRGRSNGHDETPMGPFARSGIVTLAVLLLLAAFPGPAAAAPVGTLAWAAHVTLAPRGRDPSDTESLSTPFVELYAIHVAPVNLPPAADNQANHAES